MSINLYLLYFSFITCFIQIKTQSCSTVYVAPLVGDKTKCSFGDTPCIKRFRDFVSECLSTTKRQFVTTFDFNYNSSFTCITQVEDHAECPEQFGRNNNLYINPNKHYGIKSFIEQKIKQDEICGEKPLVVFVIIIDCQKFSLFPDVDDLFGKGLNQTNADILKKDTHYYVLVLVDEGSEADSCDFYFQTLDYKKTSNIKVGFNNVVRFSTIGDDICSIDFPVFYSHVDNSVRPDPTVNRVAISVVCAIVLGLIIVWVGFWAQRIKRRYDESKIEAFADQHARSKRHILFGKYRDEWEVTPKELKIDAGTVLGQGAFGKVYLGHLKKQRNKEYIEMDVAVKFTHDSSDEKTRKEMIEEIGFMKALGSHENLLVMVGYLKSIENPMICTVYCSNGDLLKILRKHPLHFMSKEKCQDVEICLLLPDLLKIALEICNGLEYLSLHNYVHRDVAARNILLTENMAAKLGDFGMTKKLELNDICIIDKNGKFPIRHMCYESLKFGEFSLKTDVWSFGILIFEMFSGGEAPFKEIPLEEFVKYLEQDGKPKFSQETPQPLVQFLNEKVFQKYPSRRAEFKELKKELSQLYSVVLSVVQKL